MGLGADINGPTGEFPSPYCVRVLTPQQSGLCLAASLRAAVAKATKSSTTNRASASPVDRLRPQR